MNTVWIASSATTGCMMCSFPVRGKKRTSQAWFRQHSRFEAGDPGDLSACHQAINVVRALVRKNRLQITECLQRQGRNFNKKVWSNEYITNKQVVETKKKIFKVMFGGVKEEMSVNLGSLLPWLPENQPKCHCRPIALGQEKLPPWPSWTSTPASNCYQNIVYKKQIMSQTSEGPKMRKQLIAVLQFTNLA